MNRTDAPKKQPIVFAVNGPREDLPDTTPSGDNTASYNSGFPLITMTLKSAGGLPPKGQDVNQILYELSSLGRWGSSGALNAFDSAFATSIGGYPSGALVISDDLTKIYISTIDANTNNPNSSATGWSNFVTYLGLTGGLGANIVGRLIGVKVITTSQTYTPSTGTKAIIAEVMGGGGGGQGAGSVRVVGGGGGSGAYVKALITSLASSYAITIGSGGIGSTSTAAGQQSNPGGTTTFGTIITCTGGSGGISDQTVAATTGSACLAGGGQGGTATTVETTGVNFIITQNGSRGSFGTAVHPNYLGGNGGVSPLGSGGRGGVTAPADATFNASGYGGGGGGNTSLSTAASGGNGSPGVVMVWEYA